MVNLLTSYKEFNNMINSACFTVATDPDKPNRIRFLGAPAATIGFAPAINSSKDSFHQDIQGYTQNGIVIVALVTSS